MPETGIFSVTVPGTVDGWDQLLRRAGTMTFREVLQPAIEYAESGFPVSEVIQWNWDTSVDKLKADPDSARTWLADGQAPPQTVRLPPPAKGPLLLRTAETPLPGPIAAVRPPAPLAIAGRPAEAALPHHEAVRPEAAAAP